MKMISPMQRYPSKVKAKDAEGNDLDDDSERYPAYEEQDLNPKVGPCGGTKPGRAHFDAASGSKVFAMWKVVHPDMEGNCTIRLGGGLSDEDFKVMTPLDGSANKKGYFPCGSSSGTIEGKEFNLPENFTCDDCVLQIIWDTKATGKLYHCADIEVLGSQVEECAGHCMNGGVCLNG